MNKQYDQRLLHIKRGLVISQQNRYWLAWRLHDGGFTGVELNPVGIAARYTTPKRVALTDDAQYIMTRVGLYPDMVRVLPRSQPRATR